MRRIFLIVYAIIIAAVTVGFLIFGEKVRGRRRWDFYRLQNKIWKRRA